MSEIDDREATEPEAGTTEPEAAADAPGEGDGATTGDDAE